MTNTYEPGEQIRRELPKIDNYKDSITYIRKEIDLILQDPDLTSVCFSITKPNSSAENAIQHNLVAAGLTEANDEENAEHSLNNAFISLYKLAQHVPAEKVLHLLQHYSELIFTTTIGRKILDTKE